MSSFAECGNLVRRARIGFVVIARCLIRHIKLALVLRKSFYEFRLTLTTKGTLVENLAVESSQKALVVDAHTFEESQL